MANPLVTIGITCFGEGKWLQECWDSLLAQDDDRWIAVLVMDGGADEATREVFSSLSSPRIAAKYAFDHNVGAAETRNKAFSLTETPYHLWLDGDDKLLPNAVGTVLKCFQENPGVACVYGDWQLFDADNHIMCWPRSPTIEDWFVTQMAPGPCGYLTEAWRRTGGLWNPEPYDSDQEFHLKLIEHGYRHVHCQGVFYCFRFRTPEGGGMSSFGNNGKLFEVRRAMITRHAQLFDHGNRRARFLMRAFLDSLPPHLASNDFEHAHAMARAFSASSDFDPSLIKFPGVVATYGMRILVFVFSFALRPVARLLWWPMRFLRYQTPWPSS
jgi:glycosyltransferase involved in cell wall biosynthesis